MYRYTHFYIYMYKYVYLGCEFGAVEGGKGAEPAVDGHVLR